ncbi:MAG: hypothetical protein KGI29_10625, partial [Pseudomonadota bacterium]|nr:hypothetical protein [Pseudomonadota bacterium]
MDNNTNCCPVKNGLGKLMCSVLPVFVFLLAAGYIIHHIWLMPIYEQTATLWRPVGEMKDM